MTRRGRRFRTARPPLWLAALLAFAVLLAGFGPGRPAAQGGDGPPICTAHTSHPVPVPVPARPTPGPPHDSCCVLACGAEWAGWAPPGPALPPPGRTFVRVQATRRTRVVPRRRRWACPARAPPRPV